MTTTTFSILKQAVIGSDIHIETIANRLDNLESSGGNVEGQIKRFDLAFNNANLSAGILTVNHNLGKLIVNVIIARPGVAAGTYEGIGGVDSIIYLSTNQLQINLQNFTPIIGSWVVMCEG